LPDRAGSCLGTRAGHGTRPSFSSEHPPRPASDVPTSCLPLQSWLRASYCRHSDRHWTHTVPPSVLQNRVMLLIWPQFLPCAYAPRTRVKARRGAGDQPLFPSTRGDKMSRDALEHLVRKHSLMASRSCPSLANKHVSPHTLRHSTAMELLQHGVDQSVIALWLGHESVETTQVYLHADMRLKEKALSRVAAPTTSPGRYRPDDQLLAFLEAL
jgi:hypothetical protein